jgi:hypothetical protein
MLELSSRLSYWDLIKFPYFADITESGDRGWKHAQRRLGHFTDNSNREQKNKIIHLLILAQDSSFCMYSKLGMFVPPTPSSITAVRKSTQNQGSFPYHIKTGSSHILLHLATTKWLVYLGWSEKHTHGVTHQGNLCWTWTTLLPLSDQVLICLLVVFLDFLKCRLNSFFFLFFWKILANYWYDSFFN